MHILFTNIPYICIISDMGEENSRQPEESYLRITNAEGKIQNTQAVNMRDPLQAAL